MRGGECPRVTIRQKCLTERFRYARLTEYHFNQSVLQSLPPQQLSLEDEMAFIPPMSE